MPLFPSENIVLAWIKGSCSPRKKRLSASNLTHFFFFFKGRLEKWDSSLLWDRDISLSRGNPMQREANCSNERGAVWIPESPNQRCLQQVLKTLSRTVLLPVGQSIEEANSRSSVQPLWEVQTVSVCTRVSAFVFSQPPSSHSYPAQCLDFRVSNCSPGKK